MDKAACEMAFGKIEEWRKKARSETDPFNKYVSIFVAHNIFYNLYAKINHPRADLTLTDRKRATEELLPLVDADSLVLSIKVELQDYANSIPLYEEEYWQQRHSTSKVAISENLKRAMKDQNVNGVVDMLLKWLYKVRCNLIHGEKEYNDDRNKWLLDKSSFLLDRVLEHLLQRCFSA